MVVCCRRCRFVYFSSCSLLPAFNNGPRMTLYGTAMCKTTRQRQVMLPILSTAIKRNLLVFLHLASRCAVVGYIMVKSSGKDQK